ncbi:hypothetical protein ACOSQ3_021544 [Xanthoceras sorbifolium]
MIFYNRINNLPNFATLANCNIPNDNHNLSTDQGGSEGNQEDNPLGLLDDFKRAEGLNFEELASLLE